MSAATLALRIDAPMQSWGLRSKFVSRDTAAEPTKSGVVGLLAAACGIGRGERARIQEIAALRMGVRVDQEGLVERDFHVTENVPNTYGRNHRTVVSDRYYLAGAVFLVALEGSSEFLQTLADGVQRPAWPLYFGRKAFVPARPLVESREERRRQVGTGVLHEPLETVLHTHPFLLDDDVRAQGYDSGELLRFVIDTVPEDPRAELRHDHPLSFASRTFESRTVRVDHEAIEPSTGGAGCS